MGITSKSKDFTLNDVRAAAKRVREACPWLQVDNWQDYGFRLTVIDMDIPKGWILFQPDRPENGQPQIMVTDEQLEALIQGWLQDRAAAVDKSK